MTYQDKPPIDELYHYGVGHLHGGHSGRYPWGSGNNKYQHSYDFLSRIDDLKNQGFSEVEIARAMGFVNEKTGQTQTTKLRVQVSLAKNEQRLEKVARAKELRDAGYSYQQIADKMGYENDSSIRSLLNEKTKTNMLSARNTANVLKKLVDEKGMIDVGDGSEIDLGVSREKIDQALYILEVEGYPTYGGGVPNLTNPGKQINQKVLCPPGTDHKEIYNYDKIHTIKEYHSEDNGKTFNSLKYPESLDSKRLAIRYRDEGGLEKDGVIELRPGVKDLSLGTSKYSQVRILVDGTHYLKGMAVYSDDMPKGVDVVFNTNKTKDVPVMGPKNNTILKPISKDPDNPFGSLIKANGQSYYTDSDGKQHLSLINKRADESDWSEWSDALPSQFLSKQSMKLINQQLNLAKADKKVEFDEICELTNPTVKKVRLQKFSEDCDAAAVQLKAAALPGQKYHVILPLNTIPDTEVYAPRYENGERVALIRYPHAGTFEIPIVKVNNKNAAAEKMIGNASDAICINKKVADRLSGADFDGDSVMVIPIRGKTNITSTKPLTDLENFDPKEAYPERAGMKYLGKAATQNEMGKISNLITDMTLKGATDDELARAVKHSMVVIDANKHSLDYKKSEIDNGIKELKRKYQLEIDPETGRERTPASTLISRAKSKEVVLKRKGTPKIDPETGELIYKEVVETYKVPKIDKKTGETIGYTTKIRTQDSTKMAETKDARTLSSGTLQEDAYADYANYMKSLANQARLEMINTGKIQYSASARNTYEKEVADLNAKLKVAESNAPRERQANRLAASEVKAKIQDNPELKEKANKSELKKIKQQAVTKYRNELGAHRQNIEMTDKEWEAIQAGAISENTLYKIINHMDMDELLKRTTPKQSISLSDSKINKIQFMNNSGYTLSEIAAAMDIPVSTVAKYVKGKE